MQIKISDSEIKELKKSKKLKKILQDIKVNNNNEYLIKSQTEKNKTYIVYFMTSKKKFICDCKGFTIKQKCSHIESVILYLRYKNFFNL